MASASGWLGAIASRASPRLPALRVRFERVLRFSDAAAGLARRPRISDRLRLHPPCRARVSGGPAGGWLVLSDILTSWPCRGRAGAAPPVGSPRLPADRGRPR